MKTVWILSDGLPGHVNQARALAQQLDLCVIEIPLRLRHKLWRLLLALWIRLSPTATIALLWAYDFTQPKDLPDLILSAGGNTSFANILLARQLHKPNFFIGSLRRLAAKNFTAIFTLEPIGASNNVVLSVPLSPLMPSDLAREGQLFRERIGQRSERLWAMIIGGDGAGFSYTKADWVALASAMNALSSRYGCRWLVTTSRRTGLDAEALLAAEINSNNLVEAVWYGNAPRAVMKAYLGAADRVFVTADSMSMIADAIASAKPVCVLTPERAAPELRYSNALKRFESQQLLSVMAISIATMADQVDSTTLNLSESLHDGLRRQVAELVMAFNLVSP